MLPLLAAFDSPASDGYAGSFRCTQRSPFEPLDGWRTRGDRPSALRRSSPPPHCPNSRLFWTCSRPCRAQSVDAGTLTPLTFGLGHCDGSVPAWADVDRPPFPALLARVPCCCVSTSTSQQPIAHRDRSIPLNKASLHASR